MNMLKHFKVTGPILKIFQMNGKIMVTVFDYWIYLLQQTKLPKGEPVKYVKYSTGQPMGTYSS